MLVDGRCIGAACSVGVGVGGRVKDVGVWCFCPCCLRCPLKWVLLEDMAVPRSGSCIRIKIAFFF